MRFQAAKDFHRFNLIFPFSFVAGGSDSGSILADVLRKRADETASELSEVGSKVAGDLQGRFAALAAQIATLEELGPGLDARIAKAELEMLNAVEWKIDMLSVQGSTVDSGGPPGGGGGADVGGDDAASGGGGGAEAVSAVLERHEHALTSIEEMAADLATRVDALDNGGGGGGESGGGGGGDGGSAEALRALEGQVAKAEGRSKQAERSVDAALGQVDAVKSSISSFWAQIDATTSSMVDRIETIENDLVAVGSKATARDGGGGGGASAAGGAQVAKLGQQVAEGLRRAAGAEGDVSELRAELATLRRLMAAQTMMAVPPRPGPRGAERGVMRDVAAVVGRGPAPPPRRTHSDAGAASADDDSDGDEI